MNKHQEYLKNLRETKWIRIKSSNIQNCQHPSREDLTCGEYEEGTVWLTPANGKSVSVPEGYAQRDGLWICPAHISFYEIDRVKEHELAKR